ncbi:MAG: hypothetical protein R3268_06310 [Acidiferrobacterales bacterium]|nr:hypothetical protein [Acidiferrobacterales bacterium]
MNDDVAVVPGEVTDGGLQCEPIHSPIAPHKLGHATLTPTGEFEAGSFQSFTLIYTAGKYGIDDSGSLRVCFRFASDQSRPQFEDPSRVGYTTITASNNAVLQYHYDPKGNVRPWDRTLYIKVVKGFLREGDTITIRFGDTSDGSPGMRLQTFCEDTFELHVLVDPIATFNYQSLPAQPVIKIVSGPPERWVAILPTLRRVGERFALKLKAEDRWGNPSDKVSAAVRLKSSHPIKGLPETLTFVTGEFAKEIDGLIVSEPSDMTLTVQDESGVTLAESNPLRIAKSAALLPFWADLHGQSEETIGTNSARKYFEFARDRAFVDATGHQGNDFQISNAFWSELDHLSAEYNEAKRFVTLPGYEWSGNTGLGGDRNVYFTTEGRQIRRSSHALVPDRSDLHTDANTAAELFRVFAEKREDVVCFAHCGGRYADVKLAHDGRFERSMEVHSSWGTFEWLVQDAFEMGYRSGIVANSDGHKGRPGASYPGASLFGAIGGLTCLLMPALTREALIECLRRRRHYATTGGRMLIDVRAVFPQGGTLYHDDPALGGADGTPATTAMMGDVVELPKGDVTLNVDILAGAPIERVEILNGLERLETVRPYAPDELGNRIRVIWEGAEYRGRFRQVIWDGEATVSDNRIISARPINFFNLDKTLDQVADNKLAWRALTTGNFGGFDVWVDDPYAGTLKLETPLIKCGVPLEEIGYEDEMVDNSGILPRFVRIFRLPADNPYRTLRIKRPIPIADGRDNPIFVKLIQEDGHAAWTSPIYFFRG